MLTTTPAHVPVKSRHGADGQQQVQQGLGRVGQQVVLLQQVVQRGHLLACQHVHHSDVPHGVAGQEPVREQANHPAGSEHKTQKLGLAFNPEKLTFLRSLMCKFDHCRSR